MARRQRFEPKTFRWYIEIQSLTTDSTNAFNEPITTPTTYARVWASVTQTASSEIKNERVISANTYDVQTWYLPDVTATDQVLWEGKTLQIYGITHDPLVRSTTLACKEVANG